MDSSPLDTPPSGPAEAFATVVALRLKADRLERQAVVVAFEHGWSWTQVAEALGVSKQAAHKRLVSFVKPRAQEN